MENNRIKYSIIFLLMGFLPRCETDVENVDLPEFKQKLVITSFLTPSDSITYFSVTSNKRLYGDLNMEEALGNLTGFISDGSNEVSLDTFKTGLKLNHKKMEIQYGKSYKLRVTTDKGFSAESVCTVPSKKSFSIEADTFSNLRNFPGEPTSPPLGQYKAIDIMASFTDISGEENFYRITGKIRGYYKSFNPPRTWTMSNILRFDKEFISDNGMDGGKFAVRTENNYMYFFSPPTDSLFLIIYLYNTEKSYYLYHKSLNDYNDGRNPFSEATPIFSNITGGLGVFTSYTVDSLVVRLK